MALTDFDQPAAGYNYTGRYNPDGTLRAPQWQLPPNFNTASVGSIPQSAVPTVPMMAIPAPSPLNLKAIFAPPGGQQQPNQTWTGQMYKSVKSGPVQKATDAAFATRNTNAAANNQSLTDFVNELRATKPKAQQFANEETAAISNVYDNGPAGLLAELRKINQQRQAATNMAAQSAMNRAGRVNSVRRLTNPNSSYLDRLFAQDLRNVAVNAAGQGADQSREDLQYVTGARTGLAGSRQAIIDRIVNRDLLPVDARSRVESANLAPLNSLANLDYANNVYEHPEDAYLRRLSFLTNPNLYYS